MKKELKLVIVRVIKISRHRILFGAMYITRSSVATLRNTYCKPSHAFCASFWLDLSNEIVCVYCNKRGTCIIILFGRGSQSSR